MGPIEFGRRRIVFYIAAVASIFLLYNLLFISGTAEDGVSRIHFPGWKQRPNYPPEPSLAPNEDDLWDDPLPSMYNTNPIVPGPTPTPVPLREDGHPISRLMQEADDKWRLYEGSRSRTFREVVQKYRTKYGRHPPPGFKEWYMFARKKNVWHIDDFEQIMDDLRPFWAIDAQTIRSHAAHMWENDNFGCAGIHIRDHKIARISKAAWRSETMAKMIEPFVEHLPDMDIAMNKLDQPRLLVPWEDLQSHLEKEHQTRVIRPIVNYEFTTGQTGLTNLDIDEKHPELDTSERLDGGWFGAPGKQYMDIASKACPPESPARSNMSTAEADAMYKEKLGGIINNFNRSSDLCIVGPAIKNMHGMLYSASSIEASHKLVPIFSECKVNVNNDILFPANMYYKHDIRYDYDPAEDVMWKDKTDNIIWRGVTSGGVQTEDNWPTMHRQRLVRFTNGTYTHNTNASVNVITTEETLGTNMTFQNFDHFQPSEFANNFTDIGFVEAWGCVPNCDFYADVFRMKPQTSLTSQFRSKYLMDVDGHSFSGRWHAFLQSKSLGFKATIFREWHDSRLFQWRHFVPVDNRYDDLYSLLTYFIGYGSPPPQKTESQVEANGTSIVTVSDPYIQSHPAEAKQLARQGREWATKVLRRDDIEVYMFRLLLEYGRLIDDNRDRIGYSGDGSELDRFDTGEEDAAARWGIGSKDEPLITSRANEPVPAG